MNVLRHISLTLLLGSAAWSSTARAQGIEGILPTADNPPTRQGTRGSNFLHIPIGARSNAMAGATGGTVSGPEAWFYNAAGAATAEGFSVAAGRQNLYADFGISQNYAAVSLPLLGGVVGVSLNSLNSGKMDRTSEDVPFGDERAGASFNWASTAAGIGYARRLTDRLTVGGHLKYISEGISEVSTSWVAFDAGTQFQTGIYGLVIAGALQNVGGSSSASGSLITSVINNPNVNLQSTRGQLATVSTDLPTAFQFSLASSLFGTTQSMFGAGSSTHTLLAEVNMVDGVDLAPELGIGAEYGFRNLVFARAGKRFYNDQRATGTRGAYGLGGGLGLRLPIGDRNMRFDYSFTSMGELQNVQVFSFELSR
jgi:hypothetical protein